MRSRKVTVTGTASPVVTRPGSNSNRRAAASAAESKGSPAPLSTAAFSTLPSADTSRVRTTTTSGDGNFVPGGTSACTRSFNRGGVASVGSGAGGGGVSTVFVTWAPWPAAEAGPARSPRIDRSGKMRPDRCIESPLESELVGPGDGGRDRLAPARRRAEAEPQDEPLGHLVEAVSRGAHHARSGDLSGGRYLELEPD